MAAKRSANALKEDVVHSAAHAHVTVSIGEARSQFAELLNQAAYAKQRVVLTRKGKELVGVVPVEDLKLLEDLENIVDLQEARAALAETKKRGTVSWDKVKRELGL